MKKDDFLLPARNRPFNTSIPTLYGRYYIITLYEREEMS